jgi:hypothetical protein
VYLKVSDGFMVGSVMSLDEYAGAVVSGEEGFYLIFSARQIGQAIAKLQAAMTGPGQRLANKDDRALNCASVWRGAYSALPDSITWHPDWPRLQNVKEAWFIPAEAIDCVSMSIWYGVRVRVGNAQYNFPVGIFAQRRVRAGLTRMGWLEPRPAAAGGT